MTSEVMASSDARCDESKCVSWLKSDPSTFSFTCYSDDFFHPMQCAHGYTPHIVDAEPILPYDFQWSAGLNLPVPITSQYYTCCPPIVSRHCSNSSSIFINDANNDATNAEEIDLIHK